MAKIIQLFPSYSHFVLLILVTGEGQRYSTSAYHALAEWRAKKQQCVLDFAQLSVEDEVDPFIRCICGGKYRQVWCYGEVANSHALRLCEVADALGVPIINSADPCSPAYQKYAMFTTDTVMSQRHRTL